MPFARAFPRLAFTLTLLVILVRTTLAGSITLNWTAPGDDGLIGRAARYDLRYSNKPITVANFATATLASGLPAPAGCGTVETFRIDGLVTGLPYYFAIKAMDAAGNWSTISNVIVRGPQEPAGAPFTPALAFSAPWPNPAREMVHFSWSLPDARPARVEVFDMSGRRVRLLLDGPGAPGTEDLLFDLRDDAGRRLSPGIYLVRARLGDKVLTRRLVATR
jgi:hypothetical protein